MLPCLHNEALQLAAGGADRSGCGMPRHPRQSVYGQTRGCRTVLRILGARCSIVYDVRSDRVDIFMRRRLQDMFAGLTHTSLPELPLWRDEMQDMH